MNRPRKRAAQHEAVPGNDHRLDRYQPRSRFLGYCDETLTYHGPHSTLVLHLSEWFLPPCAAHPKVSTLSDHRDYIDSLLACLDLLIDASRTGRPVTSSIRSCCTVFLRVTDWLRAHGVYRLCDATSEHTEKLAKEVAGQGWRAALRYDNRWRVALATLSKDEVRKGLHFGTANPPRISALKSAFWSKALGWGPDHALPPEAKGTIESYFGVGDATWARRKDHPSVGGSETCVRSLLTDLNRLSHLPATVDGLQFRPFPNPAASARKIAHRRSQATDNLPLDTAVQMLKKVVFTIYDVAPQLYLVLDAIQARTTKLGKRSLQAEVLALPATKRLGDLLEFQITRFSQMGTPTRCRTNSLPAGSIDMAIGFVQSACAIAIGALTAHRPGEIVGEHTGLRVGDLLVTSETDSIAQLNIYFEKSIRGRVPIYVCRMVIDAVLCLERIKVLGMPTPTSSIVKGENLFSSHRPGGAVAHFVFSPQPNAVRSPTNFLRFCFKDEKAIPAFQPRMLRRFYALLYVHRYRHPDIKALSQTLGHFSVANTVSYCFDRADVPPDKRVENTLGGRNSPSAKDALAAKALQEDFLTLRREIDAAAKDLMLQNIYEIISGQGAAGGFSRLVLRLYGHLIRVTDFAELDDHRQASAMAESLHQKGYRAEPLLHGQCHAKADGHRSTRGLCFRSGELHREDAGPETCRNCAFHYTDAHYLDNLLDLKRSLEEDASNYLLPPIQQHRARVDLDNLSKIILLHRETIAKAQTLALRLRRESEP